MIDIISSLAIPLLVLFVVFYGFIKKTDVYTSFIDGSKESFPMIYNLFPTLLAMMLGINLLLESGIFDLISSTIKKFVDVPSEIIPLALLRPISGSSALAILNNIYINNGPDSLIGKLASVIQGSTETTFYILSLYFSIIGVKKIKYALKVGLLADAIGIIVSFILVNLLWN